MIEIVLHQSKQITDYEKALIAIYRNLRGNDLRDFAARNLIESLAGRYEGDLKYGIEIVKNEGA